MWLYSNAQSIKRLFYRYCLFCDYFLSLCAEYEIKVCLSHIRQLAFAEHEERSRYSVGLAYDVFNRRLDSVYAYRLNGLVNVRERDVSYCVSLGSHIGFYCSVSFCYESISLYSRNFFAFCDLLFEVHYTLECSSCSRACLSGYYKNLFVDSAEFFPVCDFSLEYCCNGFSIHFGNAVFRIDNYGNSVVSNHMLVKSPFLFGRLEVP